MEASGAGLADGAGAAGAAEGAQAGAQEGSATGVDFGPVLERFGALETGMGGRMERLEQALLGGEQETEDGDEFDLSSLFGEQEDPAEPAGQQLNPQALQALIDQRTQAAIDAAMSPVMGQVQSIQIGLEAEQLAARYPELGDAKIAGPVVEQARALAEAVGQPGLANNMQFIETVYKAQRSDRLAAGETPAGGEQGFELERAGGAGPAAGEQQNIAERISAARKSTAPWAKW